jgi:Glycosyl hydrolase catalytic core
MNITTAVESTYMNDALGVLESDPMIFRYSWFTGRFTQQPAIDLLGASGALTPLGQQYVAFPGAH